MFLSEWSTVTLYIVVLGVSNLDSSLALARVCVVVQGHQLPLLVSLLPGQLVWFDDDGDDDDDDDENNEDDSLSLSVSFLLDNLSSQEHLDNFLDCYG